MHDACFQKLPEKNTRPYVLTCKDLRPENVNAVEKPFFNPSRKDISG
jgi:hypothetical protein